MDRQRRYAVTFQIRKYTFLLSGGKFYYLISIRLGTVVGIGNIRVAYFIQYS
jgi:hypothetical protein